MLSIVVFDNFFPWDCLKLCGQWFQYPLGRLHLLRLSQRYLQKPFFIFLPEIVWLVCLTVSKTIWLFSWYIKPLGVPSKTKSFCNVENVYNFLKIFWINCAIISLIILKMFKKYNLVSRNNSICINSNWMFSNILDVTKVTENFEWARLLISKQINITTRPKIRKSRKLTGIFQNKSVVNNWN